MEEQIPEKNLFMMCQKLEYSALKELPKDYVVRYCRKSELDTWKAMHFDTPELAKEYYNFMTDYFCEVYMPKGDLFFQSCLFVCNRDDKPVGTCFLWKAYDMIWTLHWFKVLKGYEGRGIGRALLSIIMKSLPVDEYPIFLHTQPSSYRAIKLYSDFGFCMLSDTVIGNRRNDLDESLPILQRHMRQSDFEKLKICRAPQYFLDAVCYSDKEEF